MRRQSAAESIESTLRLKFNGFAFSTNRWVFLSVLASASLFATADVLTLKIIFGSALAVTSGLLVVPLAECVVSFPEKLREMMMISRARRTYSFGLIEELSNLVKTMGVRFEGGAAMAKCRGYHRWQGCLRPNRCRRIRQRSTQRYSGA